jgi:gluconolactonase
MKINTIFTAFLVVAIIFSCAEKKPPSEDIESVETKTIGSIERLSPALDSIVPSDAVLELLAEGHEWSEGPVWVPALKSVLYSDIPRNAIYRWHEGDTASIWLTPSGYTGEVPRSGEGGSNGLLLDAAGRLLLAQHGDRRVAWLETPWESPEPVFTTLAAEFEGKRFNSPNDLAIKSNGEIYFTDPPYGLEHGSEDPVKELTFQGIFRLANDGSVTLLSDELSAPNGIAFSPDEQTLYVANSDQDKPIIMAWDVMDNGGLANGRVFFNTWGDGMTVDQQGVVYATGPGGVLVINPDGTHLGTIRTTQATSNCTFGDDGSTLYITADMYLLRIRLKSKGIGF